MASSSTNFPPQPAILSRAPTRNSNPFPGLSSGDAGPEPAIDVTGANLLLTVSFESSCAPELSEFVATLTRDAPLGAILIASRHEPSVAPLAVRSAARRVLRSVRMAALAAFVAAVFAYAVPAGPSGEQWSRKLFFG